MYVVKGKLTDGSAISFVSQMENFGGAAEDFLAALVQSGNTVPVGKVTFVRKDGTAPSIKIRPAAEAKPRKAAKKAGK